MPGTVVGETENRFEDGARRLSRFLDYVMYIGITCLLLVGLMALFPVYASNGNPAHRAAVSSMRQAGLGLIQYAGDNNERFPLPRQWMDATLPFVQSERIYHSPELNSEWHSSQPSREDPYGIAFRLGLAGVKEESIKAPAATLLVFDSIDLRRNASAEINSLPNPGRLDDRNVISFADGHVKMLLPGSSVK